MKPKSTKIISLLLVLLNLFYLPSFSSGLEAETPIILEENISLRSEYEKHFIMSDGSYTTVTYNEPVHCNKNAEWLEIDNTLELINDSTGEKRLSTVDGLAKVTFAKNPNKRLVSIEQGDYTLSWDIQGISTQIDVTTSSDIEYRLNPLVEAAIVEEDNSDLNEEEFKDSCL